MTKTTLERARGLVGALMLASLALGASAGAAQAAALDDAQMKALLEEIDERQRAVGDYKAHAFMQASEKGKQDIVYEAVIYRRDADDKFMVLFLAPKSEAGKGYLRIDDNLWLYSPTTGKWERRTERERIAGTDSRRSDFDESRLADEYTPTYLGEGKLGAYTTHKLKLVAKPGKDVAWPVIELEVDQKSGNVLKRQEYALSGKLMRTSYFPKWAQAKAPSGGKDVWYPVEMRFYDEVDKGNSTAVKTDAIDLTPLDRNIFTKAWLESKSR